jgi:hypothetical protein
MLMTMIDAYDEETLEGGDTRVVMHLLPSLAPYKVAVLAAFEEIGRQSQRSPCDSQPTLYVHQRFDWFHRQTLSASRRDRNALLRDHRF